MIKQLMMCPPIMMIETAIALIRRNGESVFGGLLIAFLTMGHLQAQVGEPITLLEAHEWGEMESESRKISGTSEFLNNFDNRVFGYPVKRLCGIDFPVTLKYDATIKKYNEETYELEREIPKSVPNGLNEVSFNKWGYCDVDAYYQIKTCLIQKGVRELRAESVTGATALKDHHWVGMLGNSRIDLMSRCDNPYEKYRFLLVEIAPMGIIE